MGVVAQEPVLSWAAVAVVHSGTVGAVFQAPNAQAHLGDHVQEGVLLRSEPTARWERQCWGLSV